MTKGDMYYIVSDWVACVLGQLVCGLPPDSTIHLV